MLRENSVLAANTLGSFSTPNYLRGIFMSRKLERNELPRFEVILASLFYLMSEYVGSPRKEVAHAVSEHFELLHQHPECESKVLRDVGKSRHMQWRGLTDQTMLELRHNNSRLH